MWLLRECVCIAFALMLHPDATSPCVREAGSLNWLERNAWPGPFISGVYALRLHQC